MIDKLKDLAANHRWTWHEPTAALLASLPGQVPGRHPAAAVFGAEQPRLTQWIAANAEEISALHDELTDLVSTAKVPTVAYFSPEFGVAAEVPQYSGGLGVLAGDHLKSASDLSLPLVGIGLLYRRGFFRQELNDGRQRERYEVVDPSSIGAEDTGHLIEVPIGGSDVVVRVWRQLIGSIQLLLLDTDVESNSDRDRQITDRLYSGDRRHRLEQELVLGVGGVRALRSLGISPDVFHLNEGHACFLLLELLAQQVENGSPIDQSIEAVRSCTLFTTHTPVPAGIDRFDREIIAPELDRWSERLGVNRENLLAWATLPTDEGAPGRKPFNTAALAIELCGHANGVSQLHADVSRDLFASLPRASAITGITNGVHARTWVHPPLAELYDRELGPGWDHGRPEAWSRVEGIDGEAFVQAQSTGCSDLADLVAAKTGIKLDSDRCIVGFARRFATYKRAALLLRDRDGLQTSLEAGAQFVFAGKAHPADDEGKAVLAEIAAFADSDESRGQFVLLPDYDMSVARTMYAGCNVWLNNPVQPREACGTSGEKSALNGGLNCSILDGWWADWYLPGTGWTIPTSDATDVVARDDGESIAIHQLLTEDVLPLFQRPDDWWGMVQAMLCHLGPLVTATRMVDEYDRRFYQPIRDSAQRRAA